MLNSRFSTSIHILTLLDAGKGDYVSSEYLAGSININPAAVRKELSNLRNHGFVESREGQGGGSILARPARQILLSEVYQSINQHPLLGRSNDPNPYCPIGKHINGHLENLFNEAEEALVKKLGKTTLADFAKQFA